MTISSIGLLHPGEMGAGIGGVLVDAGFTVYWVASGRRPTSARRAASAGLVDAGSLESLLDRCELVLSICPPSAALDVATGVSGFPGLYLDANAISPSTAMAVASVIESGGGRYVDGGIIGTPPSPTNRTSLCLSGLIAHEVQAVFAGTAIEAQVISELPTAASALKMCFAAWTKGTTALLLGIRALAIAEGVEAPLLAQWQRWMPELEARALSAGHQAATKGWRWVGEMEEIAATFEAAGLPGGFHHAAAQVFARPDRDELAAADASTLRTVLEALGARPED